MVRMFKPQFAPLVESGEKRQTVRPTPKRMPKVGEALSLRTWTGLPYRSKQRVLRETVVAEVREILVDEHGVTLYDGEAGYAPNHYTFAQADGFPTWADMRDWFQQQHGLPFRGVLIKW